MFRDSHAVISCSFLEDGTLPRLLRLRALRALAIDDARNAPGNGQGQALTRPSANWRGDPVWA
jgi:hypothetical protein